MTKFKTMQQVRQAHPKFFSKGAMSFFNSVIETDLIGGTYFVTSERYKYDAPKEYTIRKVARHRAMRKEGLFQQYKTLKDAEKVVNELVEKSK